MSGPTLLPEVLLAPWAAGAPSPAGPEILFASASWDRFTILGFEVHVSVLIGVVYLASAYLFAVGPARVKYGWWPNPVSRWRKASFLGAVALIFFSLNGPLHTLSDEYLFSAHMVQHMLLMLVMPSFLIMGVPPWLIRKALERPGVARTARVLTHPVVAFLAYNVTFIGWHIPQMYNWALVSHDLHIVQHLMFMAVATMMWWPVVNPAPELERIPTGPLLMMYVFAFGIPSTVVSAFITLSDTVFYPWYEVAPRVTSLSPLDDQRLGGLIMWIPGMLIFWVGISAVFFRWTKDEYESWGSGKDRDPAGPGPETSGPKGGAAGAAAVMATLLLAGPGLAQAQAGDPDAPPAVDWSIETEVGASIFFGAKDQTTVATELGVVRDSHRFELETDASFLYGESTDEEGGDFVNKRSWDLGANLDYRGFSWVNPYIFGSAHSSLEKKIHRRYKAGGGAKLTALESDVSRLDFAAALLVEQTSGTTENDGTSEWAGRWTGQAEFKRSFSEDRAVFEAKVDYSPKFQQVDDYTVEAESSLAFRLSEVVSLKLSVRDNFDSRAKTRGAISNNDGRVLFSVLAAF
ncbi:MAG: cytochrome c oxidase assembly protein [Gemmatimonadota bacterium]|jgi:putative membrane protein